MPGQHRDLTEFPFRAHTFRALLARGLVEFRLGEKYHTSEINRRMRDGYVAIGGSPENVTTQFLGSAFQTAGKCGNTTAAGAERRRTFESLGDGMYEFIRVPEEDEGRGAPEADAIPEPGPEPGAAFDRNALRGMLHTGTLGLEVGKTYDSKDIQDRIWTAYEAAGGVTPRTTVLIAVNDYLRKHPESDRAFEGLELAVGSPYARYELNGGFRYLGPPGATSGTVREPDSETVTYQVYGWAWPSRIELAALKDEDRYPVKVGYTKNGLRRRIRTDMCDEGPQQLLSVPCATKVEAQQLERALHLSLKVRGRHKEDAWGKEWFLTNERELRRYVQTVHDDEMPKFITKLEALLGL